MISRAMLSVVERIPTHLTMVRFFGIGQLCLPLTNLIALDSTSAPSMAQALLVKEFEGHQSAAKEFPPVIPPGAIRI
jgi:hypothetical protein